MVDNELGHVVRVKTVRRCVENENSSTDVIKLIATPSNFKLDASDDVGVHEKWTPTEGCMACQSAH